MGSDVLMLPYLRFIIRVLIKIRWNATIVKTRSIKNILNINGVHIIPNGVNIEKFKPISMIAVSDAKRPLKPSPMKPRNDIVALDGVNAVS